MNWRSTAAAHPVDLLSLPVAVGGLRGFAPLCWPMKRAPCSRAAMLLPVVVGSTRCLAASRRWVVGQPLSRGSRAVRWWGSPLSRCIPIDEWWGSRCLGASRWWVVGRPLSRHIPMMSGGAAARGPAVAVLSLPWGYPLSRRSASSVEWEQPLFQRSASSVGWEQSLSHGFATVDGGAGRAWSRMLMQHPTGSFLRGPYRRSFAELAIATASGPTLGLPSDIYFTAALCYINYLTITICYMVNMQWYYNVYWIVSLNS